MSVSELHSCVEGAVVRIVAANNSTIMRKNPGLRGRVYVLHKVGTYSLPVHVISGQQRIRRGQEIIGLAHMERIRSRKGYLRGVLVVHPAKGAVPNAVPRHLGAGEIRVTSL